MPVSEKENIEIIAEQYRLEGYIVDVQPRGDKVPPFLEDANIDLIARKGDEVLTVQVNLHMPRSRNARRKMQAHLCGANCRKP